MSAWTTNDIPDQTGRLMVVTGATGGLGYETALALAGKGAEVILTGRNERKGASALASIHATFPSASVSYETLDLGSLKSVDDFAHRFAGAHDHLDVLINNAGVMAPPKRETTADGFELQFGTNFLSHFALTARLLPILRAATAPRVVTISSIAHERGKIDFDDLEGAKTYRPWKAYSQSKLADLLFAFELQRRSTANGWGIASIAAHPGVSSTALFANGQGSNTLTLRLAGLVMPLLSQSPAAGALPQLFAASAPDAIAGAYYGPDGFRGMKGNVGVARIAPQGRDQAVAAKLWAVGEKLTGVSYPEAARVA
jgi:NAD(P)-dependent dehydrogenase (short-subunit alcohol dehydrogenase family)